MYRSSLLFSYLGNEASGLRKLFSRKKQDNIDDSKYAADERILVKEVPDDIISRESLAGA